MFTASTWLGVALSFIGSILIWFGGESLFSLDYWQSVRDMGVLRSYVGCGSIAAATYANTSSPSFLPDLVVRNLKLTACQSGLAQTQVRGPVS